jgi:O-antigen/teichoic acid export membrane protein
VNRSILERLAGDNFISVIFQSGFTVLTRILGALSGFLLNVVVAKTLIPEDAGEFFILLSLVLMIGQIATLGLGNALLRFGGISFAEKNYRLLNEQFTVSMLVVILISVSSAFMMMVGSKSIAQIALSNSVSFSDVELMALAVPSVAIHAFFISAFQSISKPIIGLFIQAVFQPLMFSLLCVLSPGSLSDTVQSYVQSCLVITPFAFVAWYRLPIAKLCGINRHSFTLFKPVWRSFFLIIVIGIALAQLPVLVAANLVEKQQVAFLSVSLRVAGLTSFILVACNMVLSPRFSHLYQQGDIKALARLAKKGTCLMLVLATPLVVLMMAFPDLILSAFGEGYSEAALILRILAFGQFCNVATGSVGSILMMTGHQVDFNKMQWLNLAILLCCFLLGWLQGLGPSWLAISICTGIIFQNMGAYLMVYKRLGFSTIPGIERLMRRAEGA